MQIIGTMGVPSYFSRRGQKFSTKKIYLVDNSGFQMANLCPIVEWSILAGKSDPVQILNGWLKQDGCHSH
jgi:hypothetical protein